MSKKIINTLLIAAFTCLGFAPFDALAIRAKISVMNLKAGKPYAGPSAPAEGPSYSAGGGAGIK